MVIYTDPKFSSLRENYVIATKMIIVFLYYDPKENVINSSSMRLNQSMLIQCDALIFEFII